jgi:hypothetical protein
MLEIASPIAVVFACQKIKISWRSRLADGLGRRGLQATKLVRTSNRHCSIPRTIERTMQLSSSLIGPAIYVIIIKVKKIRAGAKETVRRQTSYASLVAVCKRGIMSDESVHMSS